MEVNTAMEIKVEAGNISNTPESSTEIIVEIKPEDVLVKIKEEPVDFDSEVNENEQDSSYFQSLSPSNQIVKEERDIRNEIKQELPELTYIYCEECHQYYETTCPCHGTSALTNEQEQFPKETNKKSILTGVRNNVGEHTGSQKDKKHRFHCPQCKYSSDKSSNFKSHLRTHTGEKLFHCSFCSKEFSHKSSLQTHCRSHSGEKPFKCTLCEYSSSKSSNFKSHIRTHTGEKLFHCTYCNKAFSHKSSLQTHFRFHSGEKPFKCTDCDQTFSQKNSLNVHITAFHLKDKPFRCEECDYSSAKQSDLKTHMIFHSGEKPFKCKECNKSFSHKSSLKTHIKTHSDERHFICNDCDKSFSQKNNLERHIVSIHLKEKSFQCKYCDFSTSVSGSLKRHMLTHGAKRLKGDKYDKIFLDNQSLKSHSHIMGK